MRYRVKGANRLSGIDVATTIEANNTQGAERLAGMQGILVSSVEAESDPLEMAAIEEQNADAIATDDVTSSMAAAAQIHQPVPYRTAGYISRAAPAYTGLHIASSILGVYAILCYLVGILCLIVAGVMLFESQRSGGQYGSAVGPFLISIYAVGVLAAGGLFHGASAACLALRDIARNSFR